MAKFLKIFLSLQIVLILILAGQVYLKVFVPLCIVQSGSMEPEMPAGTLIVVSHRPLPQREDYKGRVLVFFNPLQNEIISHRVVAVTGGSFVTRGDANFYIDALRPGTELVLGYVVLVVKNFTRFIRPGAGVLILFIGLFAWRWRSRVRGAGSEAGARAGRWHMAKVLLVILNIAAVGVLAFLIPRSLLLKARYDQVIHVKEVRQEKDGVPYRVIVGKKDEGVMFIGDVLGTNFLSAKSLETTPAREGEEATQIIIPALRRAPVTELFSAEDLLDSIATEKGVVLADNFCVDNWQENVKAKDVYTKTVLSPGPYCFSEPETLLVDNIIKRYKVKKVYVYYDTPGYVKLIETFLTYIREAGLSYELIDIRDLNGSGLTRRRTPQ